MLHHLIQHKLLSIDAELEKDRCKGVEMRELNDTKRFHDILLFRLSFLIHGRYVSPTPSFLNCIEYAADIGLPKDKTCKTSDRFRVAVCQFRLIFHTHFSSCIYRAALETNVLVHSDNLSNVSGNSKPDHPPGRSPGIRTF